MTQVTLSFEGSFKPKDQEPPLLPDVFASRPIQIVGKWDGELSGSAKLQGRLADGTLWQYSVALASIVAMDLPALPLLWARSRIAVLGDYGALGDTTAEEQITALGLSYSLMTQYTSFVAVDSNPSGPSTCRAPDSNTSKSKELETQNPDKAGFYGEEASSNNSPIKSLLSFYVVVFAYATS